MQSLYTILESSVDHFLESSDEFGIEQVKMATRMIDIMKKQSLPDGICYPCIEREELKLRPHLGYDTMNKYFSKISLNKAEKFAQYIPCNEPIMSSTCTLLTNQAHVPISEYKIGDYVVAVIDLTHNFKRTNLNYGIPPIILRVFGHVEQCKYGHAHLVLPKEWIRKWISISRVSEQMMFIRYPDNDTYTIKNPKSDVISYCSWDHDWYTRDSNNGLSTIGDETEKVRRL